MTKHDEIRDKVATEYHVLPPLCCKVCKQTVDFPAAQEVVTEFRYVDQVSGVTFRADIAAKNKDNNIVAIIEVVDSHPPREEVVRAQAQFTNAFYVKIDAFSDGDFKGWCNTQCWQYRDKQFFSPLPACDLCGEVFYGRMSFHDWADDPHVAHCLRCAASRSDTPQWHDPGQVLNGDAAILPPIPGPVELIFLAWSNANFWSMVWNQRAEYENEAWYDETETSLRLDKIEKAFRRKDWAEGALLLHPIGNPWLQPEDKRLWAWDPQNCRRTAKSWSKLSDYLLSVLPTDIQSIITQSRKQDVNHIGESINEKRVVTKEQNTGMYEESSLGYKEASRPASTLSVENPLKHQNSESLSIPNETNEDIRPAPIPVAFQPLTEH